MKNERLYQVNATGRFKEFALCIVFGFLLLATGCVKVDYTKIEEPAYLRVFNNLNDVATLGSKDNKVPFLCMFINPVVDANGIPTSAEIMGDFLDQRDGYAPPYPSHIGSSVSVNNPEFPGKLNILAGPILNGFDLSSWAQIPSGQVRVIFAYRPKNTVPFFELEASLKKDILIDTTINLTSKEVYTLHVLQKDFATKETGILLRQENFHKLPLSDSLTYVNFYNMSSKGFWQADASLKDNLSSLKTFNGGIKDDMNVFLTLYEDQSILSHDAPVVPGYRGKYFANLKLNTTTGAVNPYYSFPIWASKFADGISTSIWQRFEFFTPGMTPANNPFVINQVNTGSNLAVLNCLSKDLTSRENGARLPNMLVNIHSGVNNPATFATVNSIEVVNGRVYLTTIQRKYAPPVY